MPRPPRKAPAKKKAKVSVGKAFDLPIAPVIRIARSSGAHRLSMDGTRAIVARTEEYIAAVARQAVQSASSNGRKTIRTEDIERS